ncbi:class I SAM-dependent methyltransferase [Rhodobacteraceae bacterium N5(2021)]|uniref:Class I SAM-dependent methyltransferase n=1 Tax=Gymnodinialimonas phycosphaerae TaxID=2841589 RepID=A0A975TVV9_9RHOB|nr:class I SAM-dependent methyltransferase [Gymnodinialimonas phycosphaerae]MBY4891764.1 class I SAM-dependent methyltransferase [Gymnodinialimonas phycosphaerae]
MSTWDRESFFTIHADLPREGPGETADVAWAAEVADLVPGARICDAGSGPGGDIGALLRAAKDAHVTAIDAHAPFIDAAKARWGADGRVDLVAGDYTGITGPFDFIWSAGAVYFHGIAELLPLWRPALAEGGAIAFSEPCVFTDGPPSDVVKALWEDYPRLTDAQGIAAQVRLAGYETLATRKLSDVAWESYYRPMEARIAELRRTADTRMHAALDEAEAEIAAWRANRTETGYLLSVVRPL